MAIKRKKLFTLSILIIIIVIAAIIGIAIFLNEKNKPPLSSQQNIDLMSEAVEKMDPKICDQIRGGTDRQEPHPPEGHKGINVFARIVPAMSEAEAKEECKKDVQRAIERENK